MCTLSFSPNRSGYSAAMNRDELLTRPASLPPQFRSHENVQLLYPTEPSGGAWIACNGSGNLLALLNWNDLSAPPLVTKSISRGTLIPKLIVQPDAASTNAHLRRIALTSIFPFRLIGIFQASHNLSEWRWDGTSLEQFSLPWARKHWFSSSLSDASAEQHRGRFCGSIPVSKTENSHWLRDLHRSHFPEPGPFSICVHRPDAATVSYTEICAANDSVSLNYLQGHPCSKDAFDFSGSIHLNEPRLAQSRPI